MKKLFLVMCLFSLVACLSPQDRVDSITYLRDSRTNLCYALITNNAIVITNVPCTDLVQKAIEQDIEVARTNKPR